MRDPEFEFSDVQGIVRFGHGRLTEACFFLLQITDRAAARSWLATAPVTSAASAEPPPDTALQVAFTREGLEALRVPQAILDGFSAEFLSGMAGEENRSRRLGDVGVNAPSRWQWGAPGRVPHLLVMLYAAPGRLEAFKEAVKGDAWAAAFATQACLSTSYMGGVEPFGFADGISQPTLDWGRSRRLAGSAQLEYGNVSALGEFLLGYPNEYGRYTDRPLLDPEHDPLGQLPAAEDVPGRRDLGRNGTYLVLRDLRQDVRGFWQYVDRQARARGEAPHALAEAMVGRAMSGMPLVPVTDRPIDGIGSESRDRRNHFTYESDVAGTRCPLGAHIRRVNPRNADFPHGTRGLLSRLVRTLGFGGQSPRDDLIASVRFHRLLRRGREYGTFLSPEAALAPGSSEEDRGLRFICLNANITRQFEFVQNAWITSSKFDGLTEESDPLLGNRQPIIGCPITSSFSRPREGGVRQRLHDIPQFVTVSGGGYFFLPGIRALRYLVNLRH